MLFEARLQRGLVDGSITVCFRAWRRPQVVAGRRYRSPVGLVQVDEIDVVERTGVTDVDARAAGYADAAAALAALADAGADGGERSLYRLHLHLVDAEDPRAVLARTDALTDDEVADLDRRLARMDAARPEGPWTMSVLRAIETRPAVRAPDLAASFGRETAPFKRDVRKLKALGLTLSLEVGYRLSPRGEAYLRRR